jgi:arylsulfatase A-like enzyme
MISRRGFLLSAAAQRSQPNFIVIYTDDQGIGDLGCYGARDLKTPHMDRLAARGVRFTNWYSILRSVLRSRCALMTGQYPWRHKS